MVRLTLTRRSEFIRWSCQTEQINLLLRADINHVEKLYALA